MNNEKSELANGQLYVDLGLPSGLKWAKCNVGAKTETDYGYYFQWGEIESHNTDIPCDWANHKYGDGWNFSKYNTSVLYGENPDNIMALKAEDDAARANMGGDWRMPTKDEFQELLDNTTNEWVTNFNGSRVNGRKFTGSNGNYIFIPASGSRSVYSFRSQGYDGYIWSSSLNASNPNYAWYLGFFWDYCGMGHYGRRCVGFAVRGVMD